MSLFLSQVLNHRHCVCDDTCGTGRSLQARGRNRTSCPRRFPAQPPGDVRTRQDRVGRSEGLSSLRKPPPGTVQTGLEKTALRVVGLSAMGYYHGMGIRLLSLFPCWWAEGGGPPQFIFVPFYFSFKVPVLSCSSFEIFLSAPTLGEEDFSDLTSCHTPHQAIV